MPGALPCNALPSPPSRPELAPNASSTKAPTMRQAGFLPTTPINASPSATVSSGPPAFMAPWPAATLTCPTDAVWNLISSGSVPPLTSTSIFTPINSINTPRAMPTAFASATPTPDSTAAALTTAHPAANPSIPAIATAPMALPSAPACSSTSLNAKSPFSSTASRSAPGPTHSLPLPVKDAALCSTLKPAMHKRSTTCGSHSGMASYPPAPLSKILSTWSTATSLLAAS